MKRLFTFFLVIILLAALVLGAAWYFLDYNQGPTIQFLYDQSLSLCSQGKYPAAIRILTAAERVAPKDQRLDVALAEAYKSSGNYTKAEFTLSRAIGQGADVEVYAELCRLYVEQDKLLDAVAMMDQVADPAIRGILEACRPQVPAPSLEPGFYNQYMDADFTAESGTLYVSFDRNYPSTAAAFQGPVTLGIGETTVTAVAVGEDGLVSPLGIFGYTISGVVEPVEIFDPALDALVRELLSRGSSSTLNTSDLWSIQELTIPEEVTDLGQLDLFTGLTKLTIHNRTVDINFLPAMPYLYRLDLADCTLDPEQLTYISGLTQLQELNLEGCGLSTIKGLSGMTTLTSINLSKNSISDLTPLAGCTGMLYAQLQNNAIANASTLGSWPGLLSLNISNNLLKDFGYMGACVNLGRLDVSFNSLTALNGLGNLSALEVFNAESNALTSTLGIGRCHSLKELNLSNNHLTDMAEIATLTGLETLDISYNDIVEVPDFPDDAKLSVFNGCHNFFEDVSGLAGLELLNYVYLDYNNVSDINVLATCPALVQVNVFRTNVTNISELTDRDIIISYNPT